MYASGITFTAVMGAGGAIGPGSARNGTSVDSTLHVVLGNDVGDPLEPAALLNDREIPLSGFAISYIEGGLNTGVYSIDSSSAAIQNYFKGTLGQEPAELITIQGQHPGGNPYGNFWWTLDESLVNPDGQIDAVYQWGYNQTGAGGNRVTNEAALWWSMESHFVVGGSSQFEVELASVAINGNQNRYLQMDINKIDGHAIGMWGVNSWSFFPSNTGLTNPYFILQGSNGQMELIGNAPSITMSSTIATSGQFAVTSNLDGSLNISNTTTGGNPVMAFGNPFALAAWDPTFAGITITVPNDDGIEAVFVEGTVTGTAFPLIAQIDASVGSGVLLENTGTGYASLGLRSGTGPAQVQFANTGASEVFSMGLLPTSGQFLISNGTEIISGSNLLTMTSVGQIGIGGETTPTAFLHIGPSLGTAGMGALKLTQTTGALLSAPEDGLWEYDTGVLYFTVGATRKTVTLV